MDELVQFLREQLAEEYRLAEEARGDLDGTWTFIDTPGGKHKIVDSLGYSLIEEYDVDSQPWDCQPHIARHDPARVLREIDAKRRALDDYEAVRNHAQEHEAYALAEGAVRKQIQIMALPYADRPGYKEGWRP